MIDKKKVIKGLTCHVHGHPHTRCHKCPYWGTGEHGASECMNLAADALALLKEQEPVKPVLECHWETSSVYDTDIQVVEYLCGNCNEIIRKKEKYCCWCGRRVKWDD